MQRNYAAIEATQEKPQNSSDSLFKKTMKAVGWVAFLLFCSLLTAGLLYASFPRLARPGLAWIALIPFIWGLVKIRGFWASCFYGWFTSLCFHALALDWVYYTCVHGGGMSSGLSLAAWLGLSALLAIQMAIFGGSCYFLKKTGSFFPILAACGWVALEWLHQVIAFYGVGFPWFMLGGSQWNFLHTLQLVSLTGVYGLSFALAWVGTQLGWALSSPSVKKITGSLLLTLGIFFSVYGFGHYRLNHFAQFANSKSLLSVSAALMQPNIDQYKKWDEAYEAEIEDTLTNMSQELQENEALLTIWPESVSPGPLTEEKYASLFQNSADQTNSFQLVGSAIPGDPDQYVGAYLLPPHSQQWQMYQKIKLVPFGEFVPFSSWLQKVFPQVEVLGELGGFVPGDKSQNLLDINGVPLGSTICYESIYPQIWQNQAKNGAKLFTNITNDAWFFDTAAPYQHLAANVVRAVETGRPVLRAANTGFSAVINPVGKIEKKSGLFTREIIRTDVPIALGEDVTFYVQWGDWFAWICAAIFFTLLISTMVFAYE